MTIAITGASGNIGGTTARLLAERGLTDLRLVVRNAARAPQIDGATVAQATYLDEAPLRDAFAGVDTLLLVSAGESENRVAEHVNAVTQAVAAGVQHIVYTSFVGASPTSTFLLGRDHHATEQAIIASGVNYTFLRDNFYIDVFPHFANEQGVIAGPGGQGRSAAVARADVSAVAAVVLANPSAHAGATYNLTGAQALTLDEIAAAITAASGRETTYHEETLDEAYASRAVYGAEAWQVDAWVSTYTAIAAGELAAVSTDVRTLLGREPIGFAEALGKSQPRG
ncbi:SDR family oxidoreductase [Micrococcales bacterium 31B]|nr:SDR family oxidoreductase [Micrococcales bacterium 31B]